MKQMLLIGTIGVALSSLFGYHAVYAPQQKQVRVIQGQIAQEQSDQQARMDVAALLQHLERSRERLAPEADTSWLVREVVALSKRAGVQLATINQDAPAPLQKFTRLGAAFQFSASYHQVGVFLDALEHSDHFFHVEHLDITRASAEGQSSVVRLVVSTLYMPPVAQVLAGVGAK